MTAMPERIDALVREVSELTKEVGLIREHYEKWGNRTVVILLAVAAVLIGGGVFSIWIVGQNRERVADIQRSRREVTFDNCRAQNQRNVRTRNLVTHSENLRPSSKAVIIELINQLVPYQPCKQQVDKVDIDR